MILALDPSSSVTGYCCLSDSGTVIDAGVIKPTRATDDANTRIVTMSTDVANLILEFEPSVIVIEDTSGKVGKRHGGNGAGLSIYGKAIGHLWAVCSRVAPGKVHMVPENTWCRSVSKGNRQLRVMDAVPKYRAEKDKGADCADAIGLALWWFAEQKLKGAT